MTNHESYELKFKQQWTIRVFQDEPNTKKDLSYSKNFEINDRQFLQLDIGQQ